MSQLYTPPRWLHHQVMEGSLVYSIPTCYGVYRVGGVWNIVKVVGYGNPDLRTFDLDAGMAALRGDSGILWFYTPTVVTDPIATQLAAFNPPLQPTDLPATLGAVPSWPKFY